MSSDVTRRILKHVPSNTFSSGWSIQCLITNYTFRRPQTDVDTRVSATLRSPVGVVTIVVFTRNVCIEITAVPCSLHATPTSHPPLSRHTAEESTCMTRRQSFSLPLSSIAGKILVLIPRRSRSLTGCVPPPRFLSATSGAAAAVAAAAAAVCCIVTQLQFVLCSCNCC